MARPVARTNLHVARMESWVGVHLESNAPDCIRATLAPRLISRSQIEPMNTKRKSVRTPKADVPYDCGEKSAVLSFWERATHHRGVAELRKRGPATAGNSGGRSRVG